MQHFKVVSLFIISILGFYSLANAQTGKLSGTVKDAAKGEPQFGITVMLQDASRGARTDFEGKYTIDKLSPGNYVFVFTGMGFSKKVISDVKIENGKTTVLDIVLEEFSVEGKTVVITGSYKKESDMSLITQRKTASQISDGISAEQIKKSPDNTTSDIMKRVPGASVQDNKFAIIRGLNDRYNQGFINGAPLPSTESDRKAFSFDIFPSNMIDNMVILKTATPDLPADFAGGVIIINTKDIPESDFVNISVGSSYNTISTFKPGLTYNTGSKSLLGMDDGTRALPQGLPSTQDYNKGTAKEQVAYSKMFENTWQLKRIPSTMPGTSMQVSAGKHFPLKKNDLGVIASFSHNNSYRNNIVGRRDYISPQDDNIRRYNYTDSVYKHEVLMGGMLNLAYKTQKSKYSFKNIYTINSEDQVSYRTGIYEEDPEFRNNVRNTALLFSQNSLYSTQLTGDHALPKNDIKIHWVGSYNKINRQVPDFRKQAYSQTIDENVSGEIPYSAQVGYGGANINQSGRFFSELAENLYSGNVDVSMPVLKQITKVETSIKTGLYTALRSRDFSARSFGYVQNFGLNPRILTYGLDSIFSHDNLSEKLYIKEDTRPSDSYKAGSALQAAYLMADNKFGKNIRLVWGVRAENYRQRLNALDVAGKEIKVDTTVLDLLPSANVSVSLTSKTNLRFCASKTVSRPEFREIAPFAFYDFNLDAVVSGNPTLQRSTIQNFDIRYEFFPGGSQIISASVFYKKFTNAVEMINEPVGAGSRMFGYQNAPDATNYGIELEFRKNLTFLDTLFHTTFMSNFMVFSNLSYIQSQVDLSKFKEASNGIRPLQGQSPYIINAGFSYGSAKGLSLSLLANRIGRRIAYVGNKDVPDIWENPRTVIDMQIAQKLVKNKLDIKLNFGDLLAQNLVFYQDLNRNGKYDKDETTNPNKDNAIYNYTYGRNISLGLSYKF